MVETQTTTKTVEQDKGLREYELVIVLTPELSDEAITTRIDNLTKVITSGGGTVTSVNRWGKKRLAYPIKHLIEGNYILAKISMKPATSRELEANLNISEDVIRHLLVKLQ